MMKKKRKYWIRFHWSECAICGESQNYRERVYGKKPKHHRKRHLYGPIWACGHHFL